MEHQLTSGAIDALTTIWQRVLQRPSVGMEDPFFDVGGDPTSAIRLFAEIAKEFGRELPPETIYQAPTVAALAALLENPAKPLLPPLALLKAGSEAPPVFITHGLGGSMRARPSLISCIPLSVRHTILLTADRMLASPAQQSCALPPVFETAPIWR